MSKHNNKYWLNKIRLWFALRGGIVEWREKHHTNELCEKCRYWEIKKKAFPSGHPYYTSYTSLLVAECKRKKEFRSRLMVNTELTDVQFLPHESSAHPFSYICAEWIKDV